MFDGGDEDKFLDVFGYVLERWPKKMPEDDGGWRTKND